MRQEQQQPCVPRPACMHACKGYASPFTSMPHDMCQPFPRCWPQGPCLHGVHCHTTSTSLHMQGSCPSAEACLGRITQAQASALCGQRPACLGRVAHGGQRLVVRGVDGGPGLLQPNVARHTVRAAKAGEHDCGQGGDEVRSGRAVRQGRGRWGKNKRLRASRWGRRKALAMCCAMAGCS